MNTFTASPVFGVSITVMFYAAGMLLQRKLSWAHPLITTCVGLMMTIRLLHIPLENYAIGGDMVTYLLGPAVIALGVPHFSEKIGGVDAVGPEEFAVAAAIVH